MVLNFTEKEAKELIDGKLSRYFGISPNEASKEQIYRAAVMSVRDILLEKRKNFNRKIRAAKAKRVYYLCMEFLVGRSLKNNLYNLNLTDAFSKALKSYNFSLDELIELEPDAGLGNGGLGRLAACFMDSLATQNYPATGFSLRYEYGLFKQKIVDGWQIEMPDNWLPFGEVWLTQRTDKVFPVRFDGYIKEVWTENGMKIEYADCKTIEALAYDMIISGADSDAVAVLRLWRARNISDFDMKLFSQGDYMRAMQEENEAEYITKVLYPSDDHIEGKSLRLKQQYFLVSASIQNIIADHKEMEGGLSNFADMAAIHINDTHPALCIPELMRILMDENGITWDDAWDTVTKSVAYTNHTVMSEALEKWSEELLERRLPRIYVIIKEINKRFLEAMWYRHAGGVNVMENMSVISHNQIKMANLCVIASHNVNGVSALHSEIIKNSIFKDFYRVAPEKFTNVTNGIAHRRWLCQSNPQLTALLNECIGTKYYHEPLHLSGFKKFENDKNILKELNKIKHNNKKEFAKFIKNKDVIINPDTIFDVQAKRLHEYKRQLLNALNIINIYESLKENPDMPFTPRTFIFGAKAAPGYFMAKQIIKLIWHLAEDIKKNKEISEKLSVVYLEDYNVTIAEKLMPATEISEQISTAGKEASGTGNMKFMINGAVTIGTLDGANVEIAQAVGDENIFIFGLKANEVESLWKSYNSTFYYNESEKLQRAITALREGFNGKSFSDIANYLLTKSNIADPFMCMADFESYAKTQSRVEKAYADKMKWAKMSLNNIAAAGIFSADCSIREYADNIWKITPVK